MEMNYWFVDEETGEDFFVVACTEFEAKRKANALFVDPVLVDVVNDSVAEAYGFDTY